MQLVNASEFARIAQVTREAVGRAIKKGRIDSIKRGRSVLIDLENPTAIAYLSQRHAQGPIMRDVDQTEREAGRREAVRGIVDNMNAAAEAPPGNAPPAAASPPGGAEFISKAEADRLKAIAQAAKINAELSAYVGDLISKEQVQRLFGRIHYVQSDLFIPIGDRLAPVLAAICGNSDPDVINKLKIKIDEEIFRGLGELKRVTTTELDA